MQHIRITFKETQTDKFDQDSGAQNYYESIKTNAENLGAVVSFSRSFGFPNREAYVDLFVPDGVDATLLTGNLAYTTIDDQPKTDVNQKGEQ